jgi:hypothetical protein
MTMHYIIEQVDAYLALLHQAREILLNDGERKSATKITRRKRGVWTNSRKVQIPSGRSAGKIDGESQRSVAGRVSSKKRVVSTTPPNTPSPNVLHSEPTTTIGSDESNLAGELVKRVPAQRRATFHRFALGRRINPIKQDSLKPTTALSHPIRSNVVVISAKQLRLERERSVKPVVVRPRSPGSGATGRLAFEALFSE